MRFYWKKWGGKKARGRRFAPGSLSLQSIARAIRHTIAALMNYDADVRNCHPVALEHFCSPDDSDDISHLSEELQCLVNHIPAQYLDQREHGVYTAAQCMLHLRVPKAVIRDAFAMAAGDVDACSVRLRQMHARHAQAEGNVVGGRL